LGMEFQTTELLDYENNIEWILKHFYPKGWQLSSVIVAWAIAEIQAYSVQ